MGADSANPQRLHFTEPVQGLVATLKPMCLRILLDRLLHKIWRSTVAFTTSCCEGYKPRTE